MLGSKPSALFALHEALGNPVFGELRLAEPPSAAERLEPIRLQRPMGLYLTGMELPERYAPPAGY
jgi:hypothetical protein